MAGIEPIYGEIIEVELGMQAKERRILGTDEESSLSELRVSCSSDFEAENGLLSTKNACFWKTDLLIARY